MVEEVLFALGDQLGGQETGKKLHGDGVFDEAEQLVVEEQQLVHGGHIRGEAVGQFLVLLVEQVGQGRKKSVLSAEIMVEGALGGARLVHDVVHGGVLVALLVEQLPRRRYDLSLGGLGAFLSHGDSPSYWGVSLCTKRYSSLCLGRRQRTPLAVYSIS